MEIVNFEKVTSKIVLVVGRNEHVEYVAGKLTKNMQLNYCCFPDKTDYYKDYPEIIERLHRWIEIENERTVITTQSKEFIECLLESKMDFQVVTVIFDNEDMCYRFRVLDKDTAIKCKEVYNLELR